MHDMESGSCSADSALAAYRNRGLMSRLQMTKNKMLPEAQSINQDGSQEGLRDPSNIPLQSKEEDQM